MADREERTEEYEAVRGPLAFIADVHGNLKALDAVLKALSESGAGALYVAGDLVFGGDDPLGVWKRLMDVKARVVRGDSDLALATLDPAKMRPKTDEERAAKERFLAAREALGELIVARLKRLPEALRIELPDDTEILVLHGSPKDPSEYLTHDLGDDEMEAMLLDDRADVVVCGGSHVPFVRELETVKVVCVGSVGEAFGGPGERVAHYTLIAPSEDGPVIDQRWVAY